MAEFREKFPALPVVFKGSFDKANRTSLSGFRGPGLDEGLRVMEEVKARFGLHTLTDVHECWQVEHVAEVVDVVQIPSFLCRYVVRGGWSGCYKLKMLENDNIAGELVRESGSCVEVLLHVR